ncbi:hypothetical protein Spica_1737 [Gracilinema caldarium DSM 7334]|uniref:Uncharacterized protein n=2 Tax=Gracilinema caldarium TaxID=215591 RepID=F8F2X1_GRAC1|nr:hypothetical protein Spica_1737 [Gracilinema caldarium DSM 7334]
MAFLVSIACIGMLGGTEWCIRKVIQKPALLRWIALLPLAIVRSLSFFGIIYAVFGYIFPISPNIVFAINWSACPVIMLFTISMVAPKGGYQIANVLGGMWILLSVIEIFMKYERYGIRIFQVIAMTIFLWYLFIERREKGKSNLIKQI